MTNRSTGFLYKLWQYYHFAALTLLSTLLIVLLFNAILSVVYRVKDNAQADPVSTKYGHSPLIEVYEGFSVDEIDKLLKETWSNPFIYEPYTLFKESPHQGPYVNIDNNGFRITKNQGPWPPQDNNLNIFLFGGSTTFGYGLPDYQTIASYLQEYLKESFGKDVKVYNFGRGFYYSTQERILFEELLAAGFVPDMAIFIDGLNDFYQNTDEPLFTSEFRKYMNKMSEKKKDTILDKIQNTSLSRAATELSNNLLKRKKVDSANGQTNKLIDTGTIVKNYDDPKVLDTVIDRYFKNKRLIESASNAFGIKTTFVWQPVPTYHYDQKYHLFTGGGYDQHSYSQHGYERMAEFISKNPQGDNFLWLADMQKNENKPLYVDKVHYSSVFSQKIAKSIADHLVKR